MGNKTEKHCGIIMPISPMPGYPAEHWLEVKNIIIEATQQVDGYNFKTEIVSNSDGEIDVIHKRIIQNLYNADIVICDISGKNPNVLFELGMRLAFDKPTILIKDDQTDFIFDTGVIEHITYPKDLRFSKIVNFKKELALRIKQTYEKSVNDPNFSTFLGNFGEFKIPSLNQTTVSDVQQLILDEIYTLRAEFANFRKELAVTKAKNYSAKHNNLQKIVRNYIHETKDLDKAENILQKDEFLSYIQSKQIDPFITITKREELINFINDAQIELLPF
jgi:nucleoside 2-deoxyribosyltransferase